MFPAGLSAAVAAAPTTVGLGLTVIAGVAERARHSSLHPYLSISSSRAAGRRDAGRSDSDRICEEGPTPIPRDGPSDELGSVAMHRAGSPV